MRFLNHVAKKRYRQMNIDNGQNADHKAILQHAFEPFEVFVCLRYYKAHQWRRIVAIDKTSTSVLPDARLCWKQYRKLLVFWHSALLILVKQPIKK
jgi:hypothetical protein